MGQWGKLNNVAASHWLHFPESGREKMSRVAAAAAWGLKQWQQMSVYVECIPRDTMDGAFYRAVLSVHGEQYEHAQKVQSIFSRCIIIFFHIVIIITCVCSLLIWLGKFWIPSLQLWQQRVTNEPMVPWFLCKC